MLQNMYLCYPYLFIPMDVETLKTIDVKFKLYIFLQNVSVRFIPLSIMFLIDIYYYFSGQIIDLFICKHLEYK